LSNSERPIVLVVDDHTNMLRLMTKVLSEDVRVLSAHGGREAIDLLSRERVAVVLADLSMPDVDGLEVLRACKRLQPGASLVLMTAYASFPSAVEALRLGVFEDLTKPFEPEVARAAVLRAIGRIHASASTHAGDELLPGMVGVSAKMRDVAALVRKFAPSPATALLLGETGTGKERIARAMHLLSPRAESRFVAVNCAAIPSELLESELFGCVRGAFTGASRDRAGLFEEAAGGTLFLDEIGEMPPALQAKLTRVVEERTIRRLGESRERPVDARIVAATHRDLEGMAAAGAFREDLWYRLNVATIRVPPLRERPEDIELLALRFLQEFAAREGGTAVGFTPLAMSTVISYSWPGNVRQLRAVMERASLLASGQRVDVGHLPLQLSEPPPMGAGVDLAALSWTEALNEARASAARYYLEEVLRRHRGNVADAAAHAGVERESYYRLLRRYGGKSREPEPPSSAPPALESKPPALE
jgi:two-component system, NtrC family, response regulator HydG